MSEFPLTVSPEGVATILWDVPGRTLNVMTVAGLADLAAAVDAALADTGVRGIVIGSARPDFAGGMDLSVLAGMRARAGAEPAQAIFEAVMAIHALLRRIERAGMDPQKLKGAKPVACALPGTAAGIGLELALACHRIFAADVESARIGLPEIKVGLFPGAGGTTRLVRKLGLLGAAPLLLEGKMLAPRAARAAGLIDEVVPPDALLDRARDWVLAAAEADCVKPWDRKGYRIPGGAPYTPEGFLTFAGAPAMVLGRTQGVYPAAEALLQAAYEGAMLPFDAALRVEARQFTRVLLDPVAGAMIRTLFLDKTALEKGARRPAGTAEAPLARLGVIGAGMMGAGIAQVAAAAGIEVALLDATPEGAERGRARIATNLDKAVQRGRLTAEVAEVTLSRIAPGTDYAALASADLVIEAVFEDPEVKAEVIARAEAAAPGAILATNTSTLPVGDLARASARPGRFLGIHFFSPVDRMPLVEIIRGPDTGDAALARALDLVRALRKTPIVVRDARFFYANRCIIPYVNEGIRMVGEGVPAALVENAAKRLGMPVGPLQLIDETSIDLGLQIARATRTAMGSAYPDAAVDRVLEAMAAEGRLGRKAGAGFYTYDDRGRRTGLWPGLAALAPAPTRPALAEVQDRLLYIQLLEAIRALEAGVLEEAREGDVGAILGWGFAPWSGGPFTWLDRTGPAATLARAEALARACGPRFAPPALLRDKAAQGESFGRTLPA